MTQAHTMTYTEDLQRRFGGALTEGLARTATAAAGGDFREAATQAGLLARQTEAVGQSVVRDMLAAGLDWWAIGEHLDIHPQAAYEQFGDLTVGGQSPAQQRPEFAVVLTAGVAAEHDWDDAYGIDLDDLGTEHSLVGEPTVLRVRAAAALLGEDIWIAVNTPAEYEGDGEAEEGTVSVQCTTVARHAEELVWLRETLALNASAEADDEDDGEDLDPLD